MRLYTGEQRKLAPSFCSVSIEREAEAAFIGLEGELDLSCEDLTKVLTITGLDQWLALERSPHASTLEPAT